MFGKTPLKAISLTHPERYRQITDVLPYFYKYEQQMMAKELGYHTPINSVDADEFYMLAAIHREYTAYRDSKGKHGNGTAQLRNKGNKRRA